MSLNHPHQLGQQSRPYHVQASTSQDQGQQGPSQPWGGPFPSLHLWPIQDTFQMKIIHLPSNQKIKIGRQTNNKTVPGERNAYFDSKVLSRTHAEIWESGGKLFIKDVKSSNGTFVNGVRLSPEGVESEPFELKSEDMVEFGIDIISEDNRTVVHHKVSAKAYCVFNADDAALSARELSTYQSEPRGGRRLTGGSTSQGNVVNPLSHMGPAIMSAGGKPNGLSFDHVLQKLQTELIKSKETGNELQGLASAMSDIQDTLGGGLAPGQNGSAAQYIPPQFRNPSAEAEAALAGPHGPQAAAFIALQTQMNDTQSSLARHLDRIRELEGQIKQQDAIQQEITVVRHQMEESKHEMDLLLVSRHPNSTRDDDLLEDVDSDSDDARSVATIVPDENEKQQRIPPPTNGGLSKTLSQRVTLDPTAQSIDNLTSSVAYRHNDDKSELAARIQSLTAEISDALYLSKTLHSQHEEAMTAVKNLTERVGELENGIADRVASAVIQAEERWEAWRVKFEDGWKRERETWEAERERLRGVVREWEEASRRATEENEDREMNEHLSEDELVDEEEEDAHEEDLETVQLLPDHTPWPQGIILNGDQSPREDTPSSRIKSRKRRSSTKTTLAMIGLRSVVNVAGAATPKATTSTHLDSSTSLTSSTSGPKEISSNTRGIGKNLSGRGKLAPSLVDGFIEKDSSESGRESADTLRDEKDQSGDKLDNRPFPVSQPISIATVILVAVVAGMLYYRHKE